MDVKLYVYLLITRSGARATNHSRDGHGGGLIVMDRVMCQGTEEHIVDCGISQDNWAHHTCTHAQDAGVQCTVGKNSGTSGV